MPTVQMTPSCKNNLLIGISGGIGSGKSVVSRLLRLKGYHVYDCDQEAKKLMESTEEVRIALKAEIGENVYDSSNRLNREYLASLLFTDDQVRQRVNRIVHSAVRADVRRFFESSSGSIKFVESAIMVESGLSEICDVIWNVSAPEELRIDRVVKRNGCTAQSVADRISTQKKEEAFLKECSVPLFNIENDDTHSLLNQIENLLSNIENYA